MCKKKKFLLFKRESALSKIIIQIRENWKYILKSGVVLQMYPFMQIRQPNLQALKLNNELWLTENQIETKFSSRTKFNYTLFSIKSDRFFLLYFPDIE